MRSWRVGRAMEPHDCASWLRGSLKAHPCACGELAESIRPPFGRFLLQLASPKRYEDQKHAAQTAAHGRRFAADACDSDPPARSCRQVLGGSAACGTREGSRGLGCRRRDAPSTQPGHCLRTRTASPCGRQAIGPHLLVTFLCARKVTGSAASEPYACTAWRQPTKRKRRAAARRDA